MKFLAIVCFLIARIDKLEANTPTSCPTTVINYTSGRWPMSCKPALLFLRVQKSGSTSWKWAFGAGWTADNSKTVGCGIMDCGRIHDLDKISCPNTEVNQSGLIVARGHTPYDSLLYFQRDQPGIMVTGLRDPVSRVVSEYAHIAQRWVQESPKKSEAKNRYMCAWEYRVFARGFPPENFTNFFPAVSPNTTIRNYTLYPEELEAFVNDPIHEVGMRNRMTRMLAGYTAWTNERPQEGFELAVQHLRTMPWFYIQEREEDSIALFEHHTGLKIRLRHVNSARTPKPEVTDKLRRIIERYNVYDMALYEEANRIMDERISQTLQRE